jgi:hypothetical protein
MPASTTQIAIAGTSYSPLQAGFTGGPPAVLAAGSYFALPPYGDPPTEGPAIYEERLIALPGVDGVATKRMGFRGRSIRVVMMFADTSKANVETKKNTFFSAITAQAAFAITLPGGTARPKCKLIQPANASTLFLGWSQISSMMVLTVHCEFMQLREA